jgi:hypothetical protein
MPSLTGQPPGPETGTRRPPADGTAMERSLNAAYARVRLEEVIRAVAEDALNPSRSDVRWQDETRFEDALLDAVAEIAETATSLLAVLLTDLMDTAPPRLAGRLASVPRWFEDT